MKNAHGNSHGLVFSNLFREDSLSLYSFIKGEYDLEQGLFSVRESQSRQALKEGKNRGGKFIFQIYNCMFCANSNLWFNYQPFVLFFNKPRVNLTKATIQETLNSPLNLSHNFYSH